jgi:quinohemoprotein ethanol dehydrogenase
VLGPPSCAELSSQRQQRWHRQCRPQQTAKKQSIQAGETKFVQECSRCHVLGPSVTPDLRNLSPGLHAAFKDVVLRGAVAPTGMEAFDDLLTEEDVEDIHAYLIDQAWQAYK